MGAANHPDRRRRAAHRDDARGLPRIAGSFGQRDLRSRRRRLNEVEKGGFDLAILDVNLKGESVWPVADAAARQGTSRSCLPPAAMSIRRRPEFANVPVIEKPYTVDRVTPALRQRSPAELRAWACLLAPVFANSCVIARMAWSETDIIFPINPVCRPGRCRQAPSRFRLRRRTGETCTAFTFRQSAAGRSEDLGPGLRRQCLERSGRRGLSARILSGCGRGRLPLSRLSALDGQAVGRRAARPTRRSSTTLAVAARAARQHGRRRLQHRQRRRRQPCRSDGPVDGLILVTPFDSPEGRSEQPLPMAAGRHPVPARDRCRRGSCGSEVPVAIVAGERDDEIIPLGADRCAAPQSPESRLRPDDRRGRAQRYLRTVGIPGGDARGDSSAMRKRVTLQRTRSSLVLQNKSCTTRISGRGSDAR